MLLVVVLIIIGSVSDSKDKPKTAAKPAVTTQTIAKTTDKLADDRADVDRNSRAYIARVQSCQVTTGLVLIDIRRGQTNQFKLADETTTARDTCDEARSQLATMSTDHFDDEATVAWGGVDRLKSSMNALLAYLDQPIPSKLVEVRNKLREGDADAAEGVKRINQRRRVYGLKPIR